MQRVWKLLRHMKNMHTEQCEVDWSELIPDYEWSRYREVMEEATKRGIKFAIGGGLAFSAYAPRSRNTKDVDLFIQPKDRDAMVEIVTQMGFVDMYDEEPYQQHWIYRAKKDGVIVDLMWQMANERTEFDERWVSAGKEITVRGLTVKVLPVEELIWSKLYVVQRDRCDWSDLLNILYTQAETLDWEIMLDRVGPDAQLLGSLMLAFRWVCPEPARNLPNWIWEKMGVADTPLPKGPKIQERNVELLDTRDWFGPKAEEPAAQVA
jgi:predicted nucleotidyltransferase